MTVKEKIKEKVGEGYTTIGELYEQVKGASPATMRGLINKMVNSGELERVSKGVYSLPRDTPQSGREGGDETTGGESTQGESSFHSLSQPLMSADESATTGDSGERETPGEEPQGEETSDESEPSGETPEETPMEDESEEETPVEETPIEDESEEETPVEETPIEDESESIGEEYSEETPERETPLGDESATTEDSGEDETSPGGETSGESETPGGGTPDESEPSPGEKETPAEETPAGGASSVPDDTAEEALEEEPGEESRPILPSDSLSEVSGLTLADNLVLFHLRGDALDLDELTECMSGMERLDIERAVERLEEREFIVGWEDRYVLTPKGAFVSSYLYTFHYLLQSSDGSPSFQEGEAVIHELAAIIEKLVENQNAVLLSLNQLDKIRQAAEREVSKLDRMIPKSLVLQ